MEELLARKLNSLSKTKLTDLANRYEIDIKNCKTGMQLKRAIKLACQDDEKLLTRIFNRLGGGNAEICIICTEPMGRQINDIGCDSGKHFAHWNCLAQTGKEECPLCRQEIKLPSHAQMHLQEVQWHNRMIKELEEYGM